MDTDTLLGLAIVVTSLLWEHRAGIVALLALTFLLMIGNNMYALCRELYEVCEVLKSIDNKLTRELRAVNETLESIDNKLNERRGRP